MNTAPIDPSEFTRSQREHWGTVASGWRKWWPIFEAGAQSLNRRMVELAEVRAGDSVLDVATGLGEPALTAARRVGAKGRVVGTDLAPQMLALARERALEAGLSNVVFREADAQTLEFDARLFDAALCRWGVMLFLDPLAAMKSVRRALRPGARFVSAVWSTEDEVPFIAIPMQVARRELDLPPPDPETPGATRLGKPGALEDLYSRATFTDVAAEERPVTMAFDSPATYVSFLQEVSGSIRRELAQRTAEEIARVWAGVASEASRYAEPDGSVRLVNKVRVVVGVR
jgi:ubiquinone/menaquinone biosynthesis C-methylase UbiE